jgi:PKD repeat protein
MRDLKAFGVLALRWVASGMLVVVLAACGAAGESSPQLPAATEVPVGSFTAKADGLTVTFNASASSAPFGALSKYQWNFGDGTAPQSTTSVTITHVFAASGTYVVNLVVLDADGKASTVYSQNVTVAVPLANQPPSAQFASAVNTLSLGVDAILSTDPDGTITSYAWNFGEPTSSTNTASGRTATHTYAAKGSYTVTLVVTDNTGLTATNQQQIAIVGAANISPIANFTSSPNALLVDFNGTTSIDPDGTIVTYSWDFGEPKSATNTAAGATPTHAYQFAGSYTATLTVTDDQGATNVKQALITVSGPLAIATNQLNDTGVTASQCYQAGTDKLISCTSTAAIALNSAQDGMEGRDAFPSTNSPLDGDLGFSFTKIGASGQTLPFDATQWSCIKDNVTGLMWEYKSNDGGLHDFKKTYTNYDNTALDQVTTSVAPTQAQIDAPTNSVGFRNAVNAEGLCGSTDWRVPSTYELQGLANHGPSPSVDDVLFGVSYITGSLSSSPSPGGLASRHWVFQINFDTLRDRSESSSLRLVRGTVDSKAGLQISFDEQTVYDARTGLEWRRCVEGMTAVPLIESTSYTCEGTPAALTHEDALTLAAKVGNGWRVPNIKELFSIIDRNALNSVIDTTAFPATPLEGVAAIHWSLTPSSAVGNGSVVVFSPGFGLAETTRASTVTVRLVRTPAFE